MFSLDVLSWGFKSVSLQWNADVFMVVPCSLYLCRRQLHFLLDSHNHALLHWLHHLLQLEHHEAFTFTSTQVTLVLHRPPPLHPSHLLHPNAQLKNLLMQHLEHQVV